MIYMLIYNMYMDGPMIYSYQLTPGKWDPPTCTTSGPPPTLPPPACPAACVYIDIHTHTHKPLDGSSDGGGGGGRSSGGGARSENSQP